MEQERVDVPTQYKEDTVLCQARKNECVDSKKVAKIRVSILKITM
jgi:hypothetical protein